MAKDFESEFKFERDVDINNPALVVREQSVSYFTVNFSHIVEILVELVIYIS